MPIDPTKSSPSVEEDGTSRPAPARMPAAVQSAIIVAVGALVLGAIYLIAVRGEAIMVDLAKLGARIWCF